MRWDDRAFASSRFPSSHRTSRFLIFLPFRGRLLDGVKNPRDARFFSTFTNSVDGNVSAAG